MPDHCAAPNRQEQPRGPVLPGGGEPDGEAGRGQVRDAAGSYAGWRTKMKEKLGAAGAVVGAILATGIGSARFALADRPRTGRHANEASLPLTTLSESIAPLRRAFNQDADKTRLVLLVSPT